MVLQEKLGSATWAVHQECSLLNLREFPWNKRSEDWDVGYSSEKNETNAYKCYGMQKRGHCHWWISEYIPQPPPRKKSMNLVVSIAHRIHGPGIFTLHVCENL